MYFPYLTPFEFIRDWSSHIVPSYRPGNPKLIASRQPLDHYLISPHRIPGTIVQGVWGRTMAGLHRGWESIEEVLIREGLRHAKAGLVTRHHPPGQCLKQCERLWQVNYKAAQFTRV